MIRAPLYSATLKPEIAARIRAYIASLTPAQVERLAASTPEQAAKLIGVQVVPGLGDDGLGWINFVISAAVAVAGAAKKKKAKKKAQAAMKRDEAAAVAAAQQQQQQLAKKKKELVAARAAAAAPAAGPLGIEPWKLAAGGGAVLLALGAVWFATRPGRRK